MPDNPKPYPQIVRDRLSAGHAMNYIERVLTGKLQAHKINEIRLKTAIWAVNKVCPDLKEPVDLNVNGEVTVNVVSYADDPDTE